MLEIHEQYLNAGADLIETNTLVPPQLRKMTITWRIWLTR